MEEQPQQQKENNQGKKCSSIDAESITPSLNGQPTKDNQVNKQAQGYQEALQNVNNNQVIEENKNNEEEKKNDAVPHGMQQSQVQVNQQMNQQQEEVDDQKFEQKELIILQDGINDADKKDKKNGELRTPAYANFLSEICKKRNNSFDGNHDQDFNVMLRTTYDTFGENEDQRFQFFENLKRHPKLLITMNQINSQSLSLRKEDIYPFIEIIKPQQASDIIESIYLISLYDEPLKQVLAVFLETKDSK